jgi:hypothetical protein
MLASRLSRRDRCAASCASTARISQGDRHSARPRGITITGRKMPTKPGSRNDATAFTGTGESTASSGAPRNAACRFHQRASQRTARNNAPAAHTTHNQCAAGINSAGGAITTGRSTSDLTASKDARSGKAGRKPPSHTSREKGNRNFSVAANHRPKRKDALCRRNKGITRAITTANSVDCHR